MRRHDRQAAASGLAALGTIGLLVGLSAIQTAAASAEPLGSAEADLLRLLHQGDFARVHELAAAECGSPQTAPDRKLELLRASATAHVLHHLRTADEAALAHARTVMEAMLRIDPSADFIPGYRYPNSVHAIFRDVRRDWVTSPEKPADPLRVAVAPFFLIDLGASSNLDWNAFAEALPFIVTSDLQPVPELKLLSREHLAVVRNELSLASRDELVSEENRVRLRNLLSAASFVYGEVQALPGDELWLELRWVQTETGVTLLARHGRKRIRKGSDLLDLEKEVVVESFVSAMLDILDRSEVRAGAARARELFRQKQSLASQGNLYLRYVAAVGRATAAEEQGDLAAAIVGWERASSLLPDLAAPREKLRALELQAPRGEQTPDESEAAGGDARR